MSIVSAPVISSIDVEGGLRAVHQIVVHGGAGHVGRRVLVADREDRPAVLHRPLDEAAAGREIHDVVLVDPRRAAQQRGARAPSRVCGSYCSNCINSFWYTTFDGVQARLRPTSKPLLSTCRGLTAVVDHVVDEVPGALDQASRRRCRRPVAAQRVRRAGSWWSQRVDQQVQRHRRLSARRRTRSCADPTTSRAAFGWPPGRPAGPSSTQGWHSQAGAANRRSFGSTSTGGWRSRPSQWAPATTGILTRSTPSRSTDFAGVTGWTAAARSAWVNAPAKPAASMSSNMSDSGASTLAARSATSRSAGGSSGAMSHPLLGPGRSPADGTCPPAGRNSRPEVLPKPSHDR